MVKASVSQSVERTLEILEAFQEFNRPLTRAEISESLDAPRSSAAALVRALGELGVLTFDPKSATYLPGARLLRITKWMESALGIDGSVVDACRSLRDQTYETVILTAPSANGMEVVRSEQGLHPISYVVQPAVQIPLWTSATGIAYLSTLSDEEIEKLFLRRKDTVDLKVTLGEVLGAVASARSAGYGMSVGAVSSDMAALAMPIECRPSMRELIIAVAGPKDRILAYEDAHAKMMKDRVRGISAMSTR